MTTSITANHLAIRFSKAVRCVSKSCQEEKISAMTPEKQLLLSILGRVIRPSANKLDSLFYRIVYKWKAFKTVSSLPCSRHPMKFNQNLVHAQKYKENPRAASFDLQTTASTLNVYVHD